MDRVEAFEPAGREHAGRRLRLQPDRGDGRRADPRFDALGNAACGRVCREAGAATRQAMASMELVTNRTQGGYRK
jgi:hypothetical protein